MRLLTPLLPNYHSSFPMDNPFFTPHQDLPFQVRSYNQNTSILVVTQDAGRGFPRLW